MMKPIHLRQQTAKNLSKKHLSIKYLGLAMKPTNQMIVSLILGLGWLFFYIPILSTYYGYFHTSSFTLPLIALAFYLLISNKKVWFYLLMIFLLGFKEHLGVVWIGFGLYLWFNTKDKKEAIFLMAFGTFMVFSLHYVVKPYFRDYLPNWNPGIRPFFELPQKTIYFIKLLLPFGLLPLVFWRVGVMALPAIAINLVGNFSLMYSSTTHYDDIPSTMLFISMILIFQKISSKQTISSKPLFNLSSVKEFLLSKKYPQLKNIFWLSIFTFIMVKSPSSIIYSFDPKASEKYKISRRFIPTKEHILIKKELDRINIEEKDTIIYTSQTPGAYINTPNAYWVHLFDKDEQGNCQKLPALKTNEIYILNFNLDNFAVGNTSKCAPTIVEDNPHLVRDPSYKELMVLRQRGSQ